MQVLRVCRFSTFSLPPALPPCCCPLAFQHQVRRLASRISSESYPGYPECVVSCHGAGRFANSIPWFSETPPSSTFSIQQRFRDNGPGADGLGPVGRRGAGSMGSHESVTIPKAAKPL